MTIAEIMIIKQKKNIQIKSEWATKRCTQKSILCLIYCLEAILCFRTTIYSAYFLFVLFAYRKMQRDEKICVKRKDVSQNKKNILKITEVTPSFKLENLNAFHAPSVSWE